MQFSHTELTGMQNGTVTLEKEVTLENKSFLTKLNMHFPVNLSTACLSIYPKEIKTDIHTKPVCKCSQELYAKWPLWRESKLAKMAVFRLYRPTFCK